MGTELAKQSKRALGLPPAISAAVAFGAETDYWSLNRELYELQQQGISAETMAAALRSAPTLEPVEHDRLVDRLTALGMMLAPNRPLPEARIWVSEMARLLGELPEDILGDAIDGHLARCKFLPTVAEIRALADPELAKRKRMRYRLGELVTLAETGAVIRKIEAAPSPPQKPLAITGPRFDDRPRKPTRQDYIELGVDPAVLDAVEGD